ncbi:hypothetical protein [Planococcus lenghuensis]|uniref:DUF3990 domain-containing protein n=1 Tax=Planococcus lenghuensis TaxID=2213202 RepID=A0A1Q2L4J5_9BACL|nr:hypothetical protein [Planococcus lenghuensis]AQQ55370.1 hypothetical protein B0X71_19560 [Planococcus lenghuensis]
MKTKTRKFIEQPYWFHGTSLHAVREIQKYGISVDYNRGNELDFGPGFYLSPKFKWAADFIIRVLNSRADALESVGIETNPAMRLPVVIKYNFDVRK